MTAAIDPAEPRPGGVPSPGPDAALPNVVFDYPAAVLLIDTPSGQVVFANDLARQLAPDLVLPVDVEEWSRVAGLQVATGGELGRSTTPLLALAKGDPRTGRQVSAALRSQAAAPREALWAVGMPLHEAPEPLRERSLLILMPLRFPNAVAGVRAAAVAEDAHRSVLAADLAIAISDPTLDGDPLVWVSRSFEQLTGYTAAEVLGHNCRFLQGPDTDPDAVQRIREGLASDGVVNETLLNYRHDGSAFFNHLTVSPVHDASGQLVHRVSVQSDVTQQVLMFRDRDIARAEAAQARRAQAVAEEAGRLGQLLLTLSEALTATTTVEEVAATVTDVVRAELGAGGSGLLLPDASCTRLTFLTLQDLPAGTSASWSRVRWDEDVPIAVAARSHRASFFPDRATLLVAHPGMADRDVPEMGASVTLPLVLGRDVVGVLFLYWDEPQGLSEPLQAALRALARYTAQAVQRATLMAERRSAAEVLQRAMLTRLPEPDHLELQARYVPAAVGEQVGGDWYDAVLLPDGATTVVIGDVTGHDIAAAAHMGQLRGLLRAYAYDRQEPPAEIVGRLDRALAGLRIDGLATLVLGRVEQTAADAAAGVRRLRWTNAGHPPPVLLLADGTTQTLDRDPELLIGLVPGTRRSDHEYVLPPGSTLLLYTDGLIEHRGRSLAAGIADLRAVLSAHAALSLPDLLDRLVVELVGTSPDDDCAVLALRAHDQDGPRPEVDRSAPAEPPVEPSTRG